MMTLLAVPARGRIAVVSNDVDVNGWDQTFRHYTRLEFLRYD